MMIMMYDLHKMELGSLAFRNGTGMGEVNIPIEHLRLHLLSYIDK